MEPASNPRVRAKLPSRACEACRVAKIRCQPGPQPDICKRCSSNKKECVFRTGPRSRRKRAAEDATPLPPPQGPSQSFTIDFAIPAEEDSEHCLDDFEKLHEDAIEKLMPSPDPEDVDFFVAGFAGRGPGTTPTSGASTAADSGPSRSMHDLGVKPQFNLSSAQKLLDLFQDMLPNCPLIALPEKADVKSMAKDSPFLLLAILASASCSFNLKGHSLYDEEFRKVLGLKFVTGAERSLELLQGILIYVMWYPHHLRPKSPVTSRYMRIAVDIVRDLELDQEAVYAERHVTGLTHEDMQNIRAFVTCFYLTSMLSTSWHRPVKFPSPQRVVQCCDLLEQQSSLDRDHTLVWLVRLQYAAGEMLELHKSAQEPNGQDENQLRLLHLGFEAQLRDWQARMPAAVAETSGIKMAIVHAACFHAAAPLVKPNLSASTMTGLLIDATRLTNLAHALCTAFDEVMALPVADMNRFCAGDWCHLICAIIVALRLSFPIDVCPLFEAAQARSILRMEAFFEQLGREEDGAEEATEGGRRGAGSSTGVATTMSSTDKGDGRDTKRKQSNTCASAFRVILRSLGAKYARKVAAAEAMARTSLGCPVVDGSLAEYLLLWDGQGGFPLPNGHPAFPGSAYGPSQPANGGDVGMPAEASAAPSNADMAMQQQKLTDPLMLDDLWTTMTMGWAADDMLDLGLVAEQGQPGVL